MANKGKTQAATAEKGPAAEAVDFLKSVRNEAQRVTFPNWQDTRRATLVVLVFSAIASVFLGGVDYVFSQAVGWLVR